MRKLKIQRKLKNFNSNVKTKLEKENLIFESKAGKDGKLFGNISTKQINEKLNKTLEGILLNETSETYNSAVVSDAVTEVTFKAFPLLSVTVKSFLVAFDLPNIERLTVLQSLEVILPDFNPEQASLDSKGVASL